MSLNHRAALFRTRIKFCGLRRPGDLATAVALGVDAIGLVLVPASKRNLSIDAAAKLRAAVPPLVDCVLLFKDAAPGFVQDAIDAIRPDLLQFHGNEDAAFCANFGVPYLKALAMGGKLSLRSEARRYADAAGLLLDGHVAGGMGGRGETFEWREVPRINKPLLLAGGLTPANVGRGIAALQPFAVDVSSGIETRPGVKDAEKMRAFVAAVRRADQKRK